MIIETWYEAAGDNGIAVALVQWGIGAQQETTVGWAHVHDGASAERFARAIEASPRRFFGKGTGITRALQFSSNLFEDNGYRGRRRVIDISGDGRNNSGRPPAPTRDRIVDAGIVVNGLAILDGDIMLGAYYIEHVTGGTASFRRHRRHVSGLPGRHTQEASARNPGAHGWRAGADFDPPPT